VYYEPVADNEYLQDFYGDIKKYSFAMQVYLLNRRFQQQQQIIWAGAGGVQVRGLQTRIYVAVHMQVHAEMTSAAPWAHPPTLALLVREQDRTIYEDSVFARMLRNAGLMVGAQPESQHALSELLQQPPPNGAFIPTRMRFTSAVARGGCWHRRSATTKLTSRSSATCPTS
jgi:hypothetical protein